MKPQNKRFKLYQKKRALILQCAKYFANLETCPIYRPEGAKGRVMRLRFANLHPKWKNWVTEYIDRKVNEYHTPVVLGGNGVMYSQAEMDSLMLNGNR